MKKSFIFLLMASILSTMAMEVILPKEPTTFEQTAAEELTLHLNKAYGTNISVVSEGKATGQLAIYVGKTELAASQGIDCTALDREEWVLKSVDGKRLIAAGGSPRGVLYSAYELLERLYGVMWLDESFTVVPNSTLDKWPAIDLTGKPAFLVRDIHTYYNDETTKRWLCEARNRNNLFHDEENKEEFKVMQKYGLFRIYGLPRPCHTYHLYTKDIPPEYEDCLSMDSNGKRVKATSNVGPGQICLSNPKTVDYFEKKLREFIAKDREENPECPPFLYDISANDNSSECQCEGCRALVKKHGSYGGAVLEFMNKLGGRIEKDYPEILIQMFAYETATKPPTSGIKARHNVLVRLAQLGSEFSIGHRDSLRTLHHPNNKLALSELEGWSALARLSIWDYWITYNKTAIGLCFDPIQDNLRIYHKMGLKSIFVEHERSLEIPFYPLRIWLGRKFLNDTSHDIFELTDKFMPAYYGENAAPIMKELLMYIRACQDAVPEKLGSLTIFQRYDLTKEYFAHCNELLEKALTTTTNPDYRKHIIKERLALNLCNLRRHRDKEGQGLAKQLKEDCMTVWRDWATTDRKNNFLKMMNRFEEIAVPLPVPEEYDGMKVVHQLTWHDIYIGVKREIIEDKDAFGGYALFADDAKYSGFTAGYYNPHTKQHAAIMKPLPIDLIPQDEKYHFYRLGKVTLAPRGYFYAHASWRLQWYTHGLFSPDGDNDYIAYISLKAVGPAYVKGSTQKTSSIYSDRLLLVRPKPMK